MSLFGNWKLKTSTKFDEYMKEVGVNWALRKAGAACSSTTEITQVSSWVTSVIIKVNRPND